MKATRQEYPALMRTHKPDTRPWWVRVLANERVYLTPEQMSWSYETYRYEILQVMKFAQFYKAIYGIEFGWFLGIQGDLFLMIQ